jgi:glyoxylase-like metal-dependent hydrolase (beta-lactamase superfamily II)
VLGFQSFTPDRWLDDGDMIDVWNGLRAIHLPGHTHGHMGFYCERQRLLFSADLYSSYGKHARRPPAIFNSVPGQITSSIAKALALDLTGVIPNHCDRASPGEHLARLRRLHRASG